MAYVLIEGYMCERCSYRWSARTGTGFRPETDPKVCPQCKSHYWNKPRKLDIPEDKQAVSWVKKRYAKGAHCVVNGQVRQVKLPRLNHGSEPDRSVREKAGEQASGREEIQSPSAER